jgi:hypothetical protein
MMISTDSETLLTKIQHLFIIKTLNKLGIEEMLQHNNSQQSRYRRNASTQ